ncbi:MAG TPA: thermonuclease family protein [Burkholderiales bacterium]|jgi:endonuclease YncB( thermonuclease family)
MRAAIQSGFRPQRRGLVALASALLLVCSGAWAYEGRVVKVINGDTVVVAAQGKQSTLRLAEIAAPKPGQAFSDEARRALAGLCMNAPVQVTPLDDPYGNAVARVTCQGRDAGEAQVRGGMAWVFREFSQNPGPLYQMEQDAQAAKRGLWAEAAPQPPWEFGKRDRDSARR